MPKVIRLLCALAAVPSAAAAAAASVFLTNMADVPLPARMTERPALGIVFDTTEGRVVEAFAEGPVKPDTVRAFYLETLPELGWVPDAAGAKGSADPELVFRRSRESLNVKIEAGPKGGVMVRFALHPQPESR